MTEPSSPRTADVGQQLSSRRARAADAFAACALQIVILLATFPMGLGWAGWTYRAATIQSASAVLLTIPVALFAARARWAYLVPLLSLVTTGSLLVVAGRMGHFGA